MKKLGKLVWVALAVAQTACGCAEQGRKMASNTPVEEVAVRGMEQGLAEGKAKIPNDPVLVPTYYGLADARARAGRYDEAIALCREAIKKFPGRATTFNDLAQTLDDRGAVDQAKVVRTIVAGARR